MAYRAPHRGVGKRFTSINFTRHKPTSHLNPLFGNSLFGTAGGL
jgi:hypothetical protein